MLKVKTILAAVAVVVVPSVSMAGVTTATQAPPTDVFPGVPTLQTTTAPLANATVSQGGPGNGVAISFTTGAAGFTLDSFTIVAGGGAGASVQIYQIPQPGSPQGDQGGREDSGFVNTTQTAGLLNGGVPLAFTFNGSPSQTLLNFDLTGADEITLLPNTVYAIDFTGNDNFFVRRGGQFYTAGSNIYSGTGTNRFDVAGGRRDAALALYAVPEPSSLAAVGLAGAALLMRKRRV